MSRRMVLTLLVISAGIATLLWLDSTDRLTFATAGNGGTRGEVVALISKGEVALTPDAKTASKVVVATFNEYRGNATTWSLVYYGCVFGAIILGALAGVILKLEKFMSDDKLKKDLAAIFAATSALLGALSTNGDFQRKWEANRIAASNVEGLAYDLLSASFDQKRAEALFARMKEINLQRHTDIVGAGKDGSKGAGKTGGGSAQDSDAADKAKKPAPKPKTEPSSQ